MFPKIHRFGFTVNLNCKIKRFYSSYFNFVFWTQLLKPNLGLFVFELLFNKPIGTKCGTNNNYNQQLNSPRNQYLAKNKSSNLYVKQNPQSNENTRKGEKSNKYTKNMFPSA
jgi:hypothetical protein